MDELDADALTLSQRLVLLSLTDLSLSGETPAHTAAVKRACSTHLEAVRADVFGSVSEAEVNRALNALQDEGVVEAATSDDPSPVGKGRPTYRLDIAPSAVRDALAGDDRLAGVVDALQDDSA